MDAIGANNATDPRPTHRRIDARSHRVPPPFRSFAVRSEEPRHAAQARAPYGWVHLLRLARLDADSLARLAAEGRARTRAEAHGDIEHARTHWPALAATAPGAADLGERLAQALQASGVLGDDIAACRRALAARIDYLGCCGAGFHNDVARHWSACLFWSLVLEASDIEFVMPHAGLRLALAPGDLLVFDPAMAHGLCRPADQGQALPASFAPDRPRHQVFLTGELSLTDAQWTALGAPWLPVEDPAHGGALDLLVASFDERSGAVQRLGALRGCMRRDNCHVGGPAG